MKVYFLFFFLTLFGNSKSLNHSSSLTVSVEGIQSKSGSIRIGLYNKSEGFSKKGYAIGGAVLDVSKGEWSYSFRNLPAANYAVAVYHDANNDEKLNTNMVGYPKENYGFSNNAFSSFGGVPQFEAAMVSLGEHEEKEILVNLR